MSYTIEQVHNAVATATKEFMAVLKEYVRRNPAFRSRPVGAPNSQVRLEQDEEIALEDRALSLLIHRGEVMNPLASGAQGAKARNLNKPQRHGLGRSPRAAETSPADVAPSPPHSEGKP